MFKFFEHEPLHIERCWMFDNENGVSPCQSGHVALKTVNGAWIYEKVTDANYDAFSFAIWKELNDLRMQLQSAWGGAGFNSDCFLQWLDKYGVTHDGRAFVWNAYAETDIAYYVIQIHVEAPDTPAQEVSVNIYAYNRAYVTDNAMAARLVKACENKSYPGWLGEVFFAKAVCEDLLSQLGDAPAIQERLRASIDRMNKMLEV